MLTGAPRNGTGHRIPDERKKKRRSLRHRTDSEDVEQHPVMSTLCYIQVEGEVPLELAITVVGTNTYVPAQTVTSLNRLPAGVTIKC